MSRIVGIDLGTTNSLVATMDSGIPLVIADPDGRRLTSSVVHYPGANVEPIVGEAANRARVMMPTQTVYSVKRFIGRRASEISPEERTVSYGVTSDTDGRILVDVGHTRYAPEQVSATVLAKLRRDAERFLGEAVTRAVITVPAYFNDAQRAATKRAGELAGFTVERIVNEPTAAALAYGLNRLKEKSKIAVYDLGGGTFDLSILELTDGVFQVLATSGNTRLGGDDLDRRLVERLIEMIRDDGGPDLALAERRMRSAEELSLISRLREAAESTKIRLSTETEAEIALPFLTPRFSFNYRMSREELESLTRDIIARTEEHCLRALADARIEPSHLDQVILVGGQTRMPLVRRNVARLFGCSEFEEVRGDIRIGDSHHSRSGPLLNTSQNPDEAVALGAAIQAEILAGGITNMLLLDVTPLSLGIETFGGLMNVIIPRNSTIPLKAGEVFTTAVDNQANMLIHVLQGERERARDNWSLGRFTIEFERAPKGIARVGVQFEIDANGILHVLARDLKSGKQTVVEMKSAVDVDDADVQRMVEESVEHAFEDLQLRRWVEASATARETLAAARKGLAECADDIEPDYRSAVESALSEVESILAREVQTPEQGDSVKLKTAVTRLDEVTRPLADLMMERAMEGMLRRRGLVQ